MAELCLQCFKKEFAPNAYDLAHIVMSDGNDICESCGAVSPVVSHIDVSELRHVDGVNAFNRLVVPLLARKKIPNREVFCVDCGKAFNEVEDLAYIHETGVCPYCQKDIHALWVKKK